jgi:hypothetical protein
MTAFSSFEVLAIKSMQPSHSLFIVTVYRPPGPYTAFLTEFPEFPEFLSDLVVIADNIIIFGYFNIHKETDPSSTEWVWSNVSGPTHCHNHTLDLVLFRGIDMVDLNVFLKILDYRVTILLCLQSQQIICLYPNKGLSKAAL